MTARPTRSSRCRPSCWIGCGKQRRRWIMSLLEVRDLALSLPDRGAPRRLFGRRPVRKILRGIDLAVEPGEALGIVGESGSGKTSLGRCLVRLAEPSAGRIVFDGADITHLGARALRPLRSRIQ